MIGAGVESAHNFCWGFYVKIQHGKVQNPINKPVPGRYSQWIGLRENLQESPIFNGKIYGFL